MTKKLKILLSISIVAEILLALFAVFLGSVKVDVASYLFAKDTLSGYDAVIVNSRINAVITAILTGGGLSVVGLLLQSLFNNPLADPAVLGISSGANLGVAVYLMFAGTSLFLVNDIGIGQHVMIILASVAGALPVLLMLLFISKHVQNKLVVLIFGLMVSFITSAMVSILEFFSMKESLYSYVLWGMGTFSNVPDDAIWLYALILTILFIACFFIMKPLNAMLLGDDYATNIGVDVKFIRVLIICISGVYVAVITSFCGPIGFIGLAVPHIVRLSLKKFSNNVLLPYSFVWGGVFALVCLMITKLPVFSGALPISIVTSIIGAPILIWILLSQKTTIYD